jgi:hypothetical protein
MTGRADHAFLGRVADHHGREATQPGLVEEWRERPEMPVSPTKGCKNTHVNTSSVLTWIPA